MDYTGKTALVTGGSGGIGQAVAIGLAHGGARVMVAYRRRAGDAEALVGDLRQHGAVAACASVDVTDPDSVRELVARTEAELGSIDILVNSAGVAYRRTLAEVTPAEWCEVLAVNLTGTFLMIMAVAPGMVERGYGRIVNLASIAGRTGGRVASHYAASKGGIIALTANLGRELAPQGVTVNCLAPDLTETEMVDGLALGALKAELVRSSPMRRLARPDEVAAAALFLVSAEASYVNGECLGVTGGR